jgi:hypothetical protein
VELRRPEGLRQVEDEFRFDRLSRVGAHALGQDEAAAGLESPEDLVEREVQVACHVQRVDGIDDRDEHLTPGADVI